MRYTGVEHTRIFSASYNPVDTGFQANLRRESSKPTDGSGRKEELQFILHANA